MRQQWHRPLKTLRVCMKPDVPERYALGLTTSWRGFVSYIGMAEACIAAGVHALLSHTIPAYNCLTHTLAGQNAPPHSESAPITTIQTLYNFTLPQLFATISSSQQCKFCSDKYRNSLQPSCGT